ncbi:MFS transporter [Candidatus Phyllobacterium onerii]|uniref:MFS transporter n=1 Tax=Candidatus Phyllobacterium onerii TaxID=3020828 RepID=UPI00232CE098|nr:MFS transporter [Phyllobacterium sp. IY22]
MDLIDNHSRERLLRVLAAATFIIFFQGYMVAPIIPALSAVFGTSVQTVGLIVPAYLVPYGIATLVYGVLADRFGIQRIVFMSLSAFVVLTMLTATSRSIEQLTAWRIVTGLCASGVVPMALALVGRLYPYEERGRALGWLFGAMAGGMAFGSPLGAVVVQYAGWQLLFVLVGGAGAVVHLCLLPYRAILKSTELRVSGTLRDVIQGYAQLLASARGKRTYGYVLVNSMFHSGVFTWLGVYLERRYGLGPVGIGLALLGYGVPGFLFGPLIGRLADRWGRAKLIPVGLSISAGAGLILIFEFPLALAPAVAMTLSLGYDMTQPLFGGIVTSLAGKRAGQAMGLNVFTLFVGFGLGSLIFGLLINCGFAAAFAVFTFVELVAAMTAFALFKSEMPLVPDGSKVEIPEHLHMDPTRYR